MGGSFTSSPQHSPSIWPSYLEGLPVGPEEGTVTIVVIPTFNEAGNLEGLLKAIFESGLQNLKVLLVDDNSPDGTGEMAEKLARELYPGRLGIIHRTGKQGFGSACITGFQKACELGASFIVGMDADLSHDPAMLPRFNEAIENADVIIGSRYIKGGSVDQSWNVLRRVISRGGSVYARTVLGLKVSDTTTGYRMYRRQVIEQLPLDRVVSNGYCFEIEMAYICQHYGFRIKEVPIYFADRTRGESKMNWRILIEALWKLWEIRRRYP